MQSWNTIHDSQYQNKGPNMSIPMQITKESKITTARRNKFNHTTHEISKLMTKPRHKSVMPSRDTKNMSMLLDMAVKRASKAGLIENSEAQSIMNT